MKDQKYFEVNAKCGHVGQGKCIYISFAVPAQNKKEAAAKVRNFPRVKHNHKDAIRYVKEICFEAYIVLADENGADPYLNCKNIQEQRKSNAVDGRIEVDASLAQRYQPVKKTNASEYRYRKAQLRKRADIREMMEAA